MRKIKIGQIGISGFGIAHLKIIKTFCDSARVQLEAVCDRDMERGLDALNNLGLNDVRKYTDFDKFLQEEKDLDLLVICTPIPLHKDMACRAMEAGNNVLLEKPPAVTIQDLEEIIAVQKKTEKSCMVGFQMTSSKSFKRFSELLKDGIIGDIERVTGVGMWRRDKRYFNRSPWVGKLIYNGNYVLDGTVNNPLSHLLNNSLILAGLKDFTHSVPKWVKGELYKSNPIESEDTSCIRVMTTGGIEVYFYGTICSKTNYEPYIEVTASKGSARWNYNGTMEFKDTSNNIIKMDTIESNPSVDHYENILDFIEEKRIDMPCPAEVTRSFVLASNLAFESSFTTHRVASRHLDFWDKDHNPIAELKEDGDYIYLRNIEAIIAESSRSGKLFSEMGVEWAVPTKQVNNDCYSSFNLYKAD